MNSGTFLALFVAIAVASMVVELVKAFGQQGNSKGFGHSQRRKALSEDDLRSIADLFTASIQETVDMTPPAAAPASAEPVVEAVPSVKATPLALAATAIATMWHGGRHTTRGLVHAVRWSEDDPRWDSHRKINKQFDAQLRKERRRQSAARKLADRLEEIMRLDGDLA